MGIHRYFRIIRLDDDDLQYIYENETGKPVYLLRMQMMEQYREGYLRRKTDGPYFMRRCMNNDFRAVDSHFRVC